MKKKIYVFYLIILICGLIVAYVVGVKLGKTSNDNYKSTNVEPTKTNSSTKETNGYWVKIYNGSICVLKKDCKTIVAKTDIKISQISDKEYKLLENGIYFENPKELFLFLETNTS